MEMDLSPQPESEVVATEGSVAAFMEMILDTAMPLKPFADPPIDIQQLIAKQIHAVVILYNYYQRKRHPELEFLGFESFCKLTATMRPELVPYMKGMHQSDYKFSDVLEDQLSLTEKAIMDACKICLALDVPEDTPIKEEWPISKIVVMLVDPSKENCVYIFGSVTQGVWSFLERSIDNCKVSSESTVARNKIRRINKKDLREDLNSTEAGYEQLAVSAIKDFTVQQCITPFKCLTPGTGLKKTDLVFLESHVVYSISKERTAARFYIVKCAVKFPEKLNITYWVPMKEVLESLQGPLAEMLIGSWTPTSVTQSYHLLPYEGILSNYYSRLKQSSHEGGHQKTGGDETQASQDLLHGNQRASGDKSKSSQEVPLDKENEVSSGHLNDLGGMVSTSSSNINEASDVTIKSPNKEDSNGTDMAGPICSVSGLHNIDSAETDAVPAHEEDKMKNDCTAGKVYQHYSKRTLTRRNISVSTLGVKDKKVAADFKIKPTVPEFKADKLGTVNKSCNNISVKQDKMTIGDGALISIQMNKKSPEKVQTMFSAKVNGLSAADKEKELSVAAFRVLLCKRDRLTHQLRNLGDEIAICEKSIQTVLDSGEDGKDHVALKIDTKVDCCAHVSVERKEVQDGTCQHAKGKSISEAMISDQFFCQVLDRICYENKWTSPTYSVSTCDGGYIANVTVKGKDFEWLVNDSVHSCPDAAKDSVAMQMIEKLRSYACQNK